MILEFEHLRGTLPTRANPSDAGMDLYFNPPEDFAWGHEKIASPGILWIHPNESVKLPTGIKVEVPHGFMLQILNRSSIAANQRLIVGACVVDAGYSGEIFVNLINVSNKKVLIRAAETKIAQMVLVPVVHFRLRETINGLYSEQVCMSNRGEGKLGSTDK